MAWKMPIDALMQWDGVDITDHGRAPITVDTEKLMNEQRMVDGTLRRYIVAEKRTWSVSWENLFSKDEGAVDGYISGESMLKFYNETPGEFQLTLTMGDGETESILVMFASFSYEVQKRSQSVNGDLWTLSCDIVEV